MRGDLVGVPEVQKLWLRVDLVGVSEVQKLWLKDIYQESLRFRSSGQSGSEALVKREVLQEAKLGYLIRRKI